MKILSITAGAAGMYCGSCSRDNALAVELLARGHDVTLLPLYTPTNPDEQNVSRSQVLFGGISIYLQQYVPLPNRYRTIALRAAAVMTDARDGQQVPFYYMPTLGGSQTLRGFREFRFQDANSMLLTAEYRWEAWWALDGALREAASERVRHGNASVCRQLVVFVYDGDGARGVFAHW